MIGLTPRQRDVLGFIKSYRAREGVAPTLAEIASHFSFTSVTAFGHVKAIEKKGYIRRARGRVRAMEIVESDDERPPASLPVFGTFSQGRPIGPVPDSEELDLGAAFASGRDVFVLRVEGDSLADDGFRDGDYVVIERCAEAPNGALVLAFVKGSAAVIGRLAGRGEGRVTIEPASGRPIRTKRALIQGTVTAVIRRY